MASNFWGKVTPRKSSPKKHTLPAHQKMAAFYDAEDRTGNYHMNFYGTMDSPIYGSYSRSGTLKPMSEKHRQTLRACRTHLVKDLDVSEIMDHMIQKDVISEERREVIYSKITRHDRTRTFLDILGRSDENAYDIFLEAIDVSSPHLASILRENAETIYENQDAEAEDGACYFEVFNEAPTVATYAKCTYHQPPESTNNHHPVQSNQASVTFETNTPTFDFNNDTHSYISELFQRIEDISCYQSTGTQSLVCKSNCEAFILNERVGISNHEDSDKPFETVSITAGECLFIDHTLKCEYKMRDSSYVRVWDGKSRLLAVPAWAVKIYGDPCGESWFHPVPLTKAQANMILTPYQKPGVFLVYIPQSSYVTIGVKFYLSVLVKNGNGFKTIDCPVRGLDGGKVKLSTDEKEYSCIQELIAHLKTNKVCIPCRLRMAPKEVNQKVLPGKNYEMKWYIRENALTFSDDRVPQGTYGNVLQATYYNLLVAVKYQSLYHKDDPWASENFLEEARILSQLDHRNIVQLQGFCFDSAEKPYIVMEGLVGGSLQQAIKDKQVGKSVEDVTMMFKQVLFALRYLENKSYIIHRKVAACNFLMGESQCLKLVDFGLARRVSQDDFMNGDPEKIFVRWSAPEVLIKGQFSTKSDVWSAGILLWELLSDGSEKPYGTLSSSEFTEIVKSGGRLCCPNGKDASIKDIFKVVTTRCWQHSAKQRPSASDLLDVISTRMNLHKESISQAAISQGLYLPDRNFQFMTEREMKRRSKKLRPSGGGSYYYQYFD